MWRDWKRIAHIVAAVAFAGCTADLGTEGLDHEIDEPLTASDDWEVDDEGVIEDDAVAAQESALTAAGACSTGLMEPASSVTLLRGERLHFSASMGVPAGERLKSFYVQIAAPDGGLHKYAMKDFDGPGGCERSRDVTIPRRADLTDDAGEAYGVTLVMKTTTRDANKKLHEKLRFFAGAAFYVECNPDIKKNCEGDDTTPPPPPPPPSGDCGSPLEAEVVALVNKARASAGAGPLVCDGAVLDMARDHTSAMCRSGILSHDGAGDGTFVSRLGAHGLIRPHFEAGENIARGQTTAHDVMFGTYGWMNSPPHRENILRKSFARIGVGSQSCGKMYWTQVFTN